MPIVLMNRSRYPWPLAFWPQSLNRNGNDACDNQFSSQIVTVYFFTEITEIQGQTDGQADKQGAMLNALP